MNIQLCQSQPLQNAIKLKFNRNQIPKAQLHPELLNGIVTCDRESFEIRSEIKYGDHLGLPNPQDVEHLKHFLPAPAECKAEWKHTNQKNGDDTLIIPQELRFVFADSSFLVLKTQTTSDVTQLTNPLPSDQTGRFMATPGEGKISIVRVGSQKSLPMSPLSDAELQTQAAILGVKWDKKASRETMLTMMNEAREKKDAEKDALQPA